MKKSKNSKNSSDSDDKRESHLDRSRDNELEIKSDEDEISIKEKTTNDFLTKISNYKNSKVISTNISIEDCINLFDDENAKVLTTNDPYKKLANDVSSNLSITPKDKQDIYKDQIIKIIKDMKKSDEIVELPKLPYGQKLSDDEFIDLLKDCVSYANYTFNELDIVYIKNKLLTDNLPALENLFKRGQIYKDVIQNALLTILISQNKKDQDDNFSLLKIKDTTATPIIEMNFNNNDKYKLNIEEFKEVFSSYMYLQNYKKTLIKFIPNFSKIVTSDAKLKQYIKTHFNEHYIYFCDLPKNICAITIHTGNIYIKSEYLYEYFNEKTDDSQLIIREKIILDIGHELAHALLREISDDMRVNFFIKSSHSNKTKNAEIQFKDKFTNEFHALDINESGNILDFNLFNKYYFDDIYTKEAELFLDIKSVTSIKDFHNSLDNVILEERKKGIISNQVNKFKKLNIEHIRRCIRSRILRTRKVNEEEYNKKYSDSDSD